ncbi:MAG: GTP cyclohydrolase I FolE [Sphingomonas sp.]|nr:GTP cyclohydrolase I FolE [Sphingomonas sp.]
MYSTSHQHLRAFARAREKKEHFLKLSQCQTDIAGQAASDLGARHGKPDRADIEGAVRTLIRAAGDNPDREGLVDTPARVARAYREWFSGYAINPAALLSRTFTEAESYQETVQLCNIPLVSTCEHHMAPIIGVAHVGYRPRERVVGISKLSRLVDAFSRRLQLQERLTKQIGIALWDALDPRGVAIVIDATHGCMATRGVNQRGVTMRTECWLGDFQEDRDLRRDFLTSVSDARASVA